MVDLPTQQGSLAQSLNLLVDTFQMPAIVHSLLMSDVFGVKLPGHRSTPVDIPLTDIHGDRF